MANTCEKESFERFEDIVPRNEFDWEGGVILYSSFWNRLFTVDFGTGDALTMEDLDEGFDDYIMVTRWHPDGSKPVENIIADAAMTGYLDDDTDGVVEEDGGCMLLKRSEWTDGDIRRFIGDALEFAGYERPYGTQEWTDVLFVSKHN